MTYSPQQFARGICRGDEKVVRAFYKQYGKDMYVRIYAILNGNSNDAKDVLQNVMMRVVRSNPRWRNEAALKAWIKVVCRSCAVDFIRKESTYRDIEIFEFDDEFSMKPLEILEVALDRISVEDRALVHAVYFDRVNRFSYAKEIGMSYKALESKLSRIRVKIRKYMQEVERCG